MSGASQGRGRDPRTRSSISAVVRDLEHGRLSGTAYRAAARARLFARVPRVLHEHEFSSSPFDKAFSCAWRSNSQVLVGTKCNRLLRVDIGDGSVVEIPLPSPGGLAERLRSGGESAQPGWALDDDSGRPRRTPGDGSEGAGRVPGGARPLAPASDPPEGGLRERTWAAGGGIHLRGPRHGLSRDRGDGRRAEPSPTALPGGGGGGGASDPSASPTGRRLASPLPSSAALGGGVHALERSPEGDRIACGSGDPCDVAVLRDHGVESLPMAELVLRGHDDWVFALAWVSPTRLVTGSRDHSVALWDIPLGGDGSSGGSGGVWDVGGSEREAGSACSGGGDRLGAPRVDTKRPRRDRVDPPAALAAGPPAQLRVIKPAARSGNFAGKVRDVKYEPSAGRVAALSTEGVVRIHDPACDLKTVRTIHLFSLASLPVDARELTCMAASPNLLAVGSAAAVTLVDPRGANAVVRSLASPDAGAGVRSVSFREDVLTFGTGRGLVCFYDVRAGRLLSGGPGGSGREALVLGGWGGPGSGGPGISPRPTIPSSSGFAGPLDGFARPPRAHPPPDSPLALAPSPRGDSSLPDSDDDPCTLRTGRGWLLRDETYWELFDDSDVWQACHAHAWDDSGTRLFVAGGPLACGLHGSYMALWR